MIRRKAFGLLGAALVTLAGASTQAAAAGGGYGWQSAYSGNDLYGSCQQHFPSADDGLCMGYITGFITATSMLMGDRCWFNVPDGVTGEQLRDVVMLRLQQHPETRQKLAGELIYNAMRAAFPCKKP